MENLNINSSELDRFKVIFSGNEKFMEYYRGLSSKNVRKMNLNGLKEKDAGVLVSKEKINKVVSLIDEVEKLGEDVSNYRVVFNKVLEQKSNVKIYSDLENMYRKLNNYYGRYICVRNILSSIKDGTGLNLSNKDLDFCIEFYLKELNNLKNDDVFLNDSFSKYVGEFYLVGYELMMREFLVKGESILYSYFINSAHDVNIIDDIISMEVNGLSNSKGNYGLNELNRIINKKCCYFDKDVIIQLIICMYPNVVKRFLKRKINGFKNRLECIYNNYKVCSDKYKECQINFFQYTLKSFKLKKEYMEILDQYNDFISSYCYFYDGYVSELKRSIRVMTANVKNNSL